MKKISLLTAVFLVAALLFASCTTSVETSNSFSSKTAITKADFESKALVKGLGTVDDTASFARYSHVKSVTIAYSGEKTAVKWQAEFYECTDPVKTAAMFDNNKSTLSQGASNTKNALGSNYATFEAEAEGKYRYLAYVDATMLYVNVDAQYEDEVRSFIDTLGY